MNINTTNNTGKRPSQISRRQLTPQEIKLQEIIEFLQTKRDYAKNLQTTAPMHILKTAALGEVFVNFRDPETGVIIDWSLHLGNMQGDWYARWMNLEAEGGKILSPHAHFMGYEGSDYSVIAETFDMFADEVGRRFLDGYEDVWEEAPETDTTKAQMLYAIEELRKHLENMSAIEVADMYGRPGTMSVRVEFTQYRNDNLTMEMHRSDKYDSPVLVTTVGRN